MKEYKNGEWSPSEPIAGEIVRVYDFAGGYAEMAWTEEVKRNKIVVTSHSKRALVEVGGNLEVTIEFRDGDNNLIPINDSFAVPVSRLGGTNYRTLLMTFVNGVCTKSATWSDAGEFEITEAMVNLHLNEEDKLDFDGFNITVAE